MDHPDIEEFIDWKVNEEQKVASLVTGSIHNNRALNKVIKACFEFETTTESDKFDPKKSNFKSNY